VLGATIAGSDIAVVTGFIGSNDSVSAARDLSTRLAGIGATEAALD
jgi:hypothetical protein